MKAMNCPGTCSSAAAPELPRPAAALRRASTLHRNERAGTLHGRVQHVTQDDAHIFAPPTRSRRRSPPPSTTAVPVRPVRDDGERELSTRPENKLGSDEEWDITEGALRVALERNEMPYEPREGDSTTGRRSTSHGGRDGTEWQMGTIQLDSQMPARFGLTYMGADNAEHTLYVHRALLGSLRAVHRDSGRALRRAFPSGSRPSSFGSSRSARITARRRAHWPRSSRTSGWRSTTPTRPSASGSGTPRWRRSRTRSSTATGSRRTRWQSGSAAASNRHEVSTNW